MFDVAQQNTNDKFCKHNEKVQKVEQEYLQSKAKADEVYNKRLPVEKMMIADLKTILKPLKQKDDGPMPVKKKDLLEKYKQWVGRPEPQFVYEAVGLNDGEQEIRNEDDGDDSGDGTGIQTALV